ncbi:Hyaluronan synthase [Methylophilaceae bacterium]|nr:Hyaluronan synthase [Methylophilaceae bacterium]
MKISIAVPSYNYARFLDACLGSIRSQDYSDYEVLIADGGSNDGSLEIIRRFCDEDARFRLVSTEDNGQADSIFKAFQYATGDILCFLNADDCYLCKDALSSVVKEFQHYDAIHLVSFGGYYLDANGHWLKPVRYRYHPFDGFHLMRYRTAVLQPGTFWRREVYEASEWPKHFNFVFDVVFFYRAYQKYSWLEVSKPVAGYRLHGDNKSMTVRAARVLELADFEELKFGRGSLRAVYLRSIGRLIKWLEGCGATGAKISRFVYLAVNGLAYLTCYRMPGI